MRPISLFTLTRARTRMRGNGKIGRIRRTRRRHALMWNRGDGQQVAFIGMETAAAALTLTYRWRRGEGSW